MIVIPMAGLSSRFFKAGYNKPKYMLEAHGESLFDHSIKSFSKYFQTEKFIFIVRDVYNTAEFVDSSAKKLGIKDYEIFILDKETQGQAETVALGVQNYKNTDTTLTIFNIDTFRPNFIFPDLSLLGNGYLEVFEGEGDNWSFVKPAKEGSTQVILTTEKQPISNLCCTGLYHFSSISLFLETFQEYSSQPKEKWEKGELYVAPLYNLLIQKNKEIHYHLIESDEVIFCGTPQEYTNFLIV